MSRYLSTFRPSGSVWLWAVCGLVAVSLTQGSGNNSGMARAGVGLEAYHSEFRDWAIEDSEYQATNLSPPVSFPGSSIPIELLSLSLHDASSSSVALPQPGSTLITNSFFDVFVDLEIGGAPQHIDSFFDITYRLRGLSGGSTTAEVELEALALTHGNLGPNVMIRESPTIRSLGTHSITQPPTGGYRIDSFFDVFTELSLNGGADWIPASGPIHMELTSVGIPEPASLMLAGIIGIAGLGVRLRRRWRP